MQHSIHPALHQSLVQHHAFVQRLALRLTRDPNEAQDVAQDTFLRALQREQEGTKALRPWLAASIRGIARNRRRGARRREEREGLVARPEAAPVAKLAMRQEVVDAVLRLREPFRSTVVMTYELGLTPREIADREGVAEATVRSRLHRAHATLRETLRLDDEQGEQRRHALVLLAMSKQISMRIGSPGYAASIGAAAAACALVVGAVWGTSSLRGESSDSLVSVPPPSLSSSHAASESPEPGLPSPGPGIPRGERVPAGAVPAREQGHPYWVAVRAARDSIAGYEVDESPASQALRAKMETRVLTDPPLPHAAELASVIRSVLKAHGASVERLELNIAETSSLTRPEWTTVPQGLCLAEWLDLVLALHRVDARWEIFDGALYVAPLDSLMPRAVHHTFRLDDLLIDPAPYFEGGTPPHPIYGSTVSASDLAAEFLEQQGAWTSQEATFNVTARASEDRTSVVCRALPRQLLRAQRHMDRLRAYRQSLPGEGRTGAPSRAYRGRHDRKAARIVARARRHPEGIAEFIGTRERSRGLVGEVWTAAAQLLRDQRAHLTLNVQSGCVVVSAATDSLSFPKASLWLDLRPELDGQPIPQDRVNQSPILSEMSDGSGPLLLVPETLMRYLQLAVEPESWDQDPRNRFSASGEMQLYVHQDPWVLGEIEDAVERLLGRR